MKINGIEATINNLGALLFDTSHTPYMRPWDQKGIVCGDVVFEYVPESVASTCTVSIDFSGELNKDQLWNVQQLEDMALRCDRFEYQHRLMEYLGHVTKGDGFTLSELLYYLEVTKAHVRNAAIDVLLETLPEEIREEWKAWWNSKETREKYGRVS
jgi:hypothetical protein